MSKFTNFLLGNNFVGIELLSDVLGEKAAVVTLKKRRGELSISSKMTCAPADVPFKSLEALPCSLVINTKSVIQKEVSAVDESDDKLLFKAFPNLDRGDFYYTMWRFQSHSIVWVARKSYVDDVVAKYSQNKVEVVAVSLGVGSLSAIIEYLPQIDINTNTHVLSQSREKLMVIDSPDIKQHDINGLQVRSDFVVGFASVIQLVAGIRNSGGNVQSENADRLNKFLQQRFSRDVLAIFTAACFIILLINFFVFSCYFQKNNKLDQQQTAEHASLTQIEKSKQRIVLKEKKVKSLFHDGVKNTLIINKIARSVPSSILLDMLDYNPVEGAVKADTDIKIETGVIVISGTTLNNAGFTDWVGEMGRWSEIRDIVILSFGKNELGQTAFSIKIFIDEAE